MNGIHIYRKRISQYIKRTFDCILAFICLALCFPLFVIFYIIIRKENGCPVIFSQERIGKGGKSFMILKFRTMIEEAEKDGVPQLAEKNDNRLTPFGKWLRKHHLDELPQLWNVLRGDMAFIGPRPERKYFIDKIMEHDSRYELLYQIRPGVTSYATLYNGYTDTMEKMLRRLELDLYYLEHNSLWFDMKILIKTFLKIVGGKKI